MPVHSTSSNSSPFYTYICRHCEKIFALQLLLFHLCNKNLNYKFKSKWNLSQFYVLILRNGMKYQNKNPQFFYSPQFFSLEVCVRRTIYEVSILGDPKLRLNGNGTLSKNWENTQNRLKRGDIIILKKWLFIIGPLDSNKFPILENWNTLINVLIQQCEIKMNFFFF